MIKSEWIDFLSAALTPVIAVLTVIIAFRQYSIAKRAVKLELYEKRYKVFHALKSMLSVIYSKGNVTDQDLIEFINGTNESSFLFDNKINNYLQEVYEKAIELQGYREQLDGDELPISNERTIVSNKTKEMKIWFHEQSKICVNKFKSFLDFRKI